MKSHSLIASRKNSFFSIIIWIITSIFVTVLYRYLIQSPNWDPSELRYIDIVYQVISTLVLVIILVYVISLIFNEIAHSFILDGAVIKRFFPLIKVIVLSTIWIA